MEVKIKRLFHGVASVRSNQVEKAKELKEGLEIVLIGTGEMMFIPYEDLDKGKKMLQWFKSKHNGERYYLIDFIWKPDKSNQKKLL